LGPSTPEIVCLCDLFTPELNVLFPAGHHRTGSISHLELSASIEDSQAGVGLGYLPDIVLCIKNLESFTLEFYTPWKQVDSSFSTIGPQEMRQLLQIYASTLVGLEIAASDSAAFPSTSLIGSLTEYTRLKILAIPEPFLVATRGQFSTLTDVLPPKLEELQLQFPQFWTEGKNEDRATRIKKLEQLAAAKLVRFPDLRRVIW